MKVALPKETAEGETRVAFIPESIAKLTEVGAAVEVQAGAGEMAFIGDSEYAEAGAQIVDDAGALMREADVIVKVQKPNEAELDLIKRGAVLISFLQPLTDHEVVRQLAQRGVTAFAMEMIPRITRAQSMDALSSMSTIAGYRAVLLGAQALGKFFPMFMTAAGTVRPSRVLILGAGVAGLQAIATARRLGAEVEAFDTRPAVKEQVESLGARFIELEIEHEGMEAEGGYARELTAEEQKQERELVAGRVEQADVVITTALVPGKKAPILITEDTVKRMKNGSVIVDLAAEMGGNCELTQAGQDALVHQVKVLGPLNLPATMSTHASQLYSKNVSGLLLCMIEEGQLKLDLEDDVLGPTCVTHQGQIVSPAVKAAVESGVGAA